MEEKIPNLEIAAPAEETPILLMSKGEEVVRFSPDGKIFIRGEQVDDNKKVYEAFRLWMSSCTCLNCGQKVGPLDKES